MTQKQTSLSDRMLVCPSCGLRPSHYGEYYKGDVGYAIEELDEEVVVLRTSNVWDNIEEVIQTYLRCDNGHEWGIPPHLRVEWN